MNCSTREGFGSIALLQTPELAQSPGNISRCVGCNNYETSRGFFELLMNMHLFGLGMGPRDEVWWASHVFTEV